MKDLRLARGSFVAVLCCAVACVIAAIVAISAMGAVYGMVPGAGDVLTYLYQINALFCLFAAGSSFAILWVHRSRSAWAKSMCWGMLILAIMYLTPFITDTIGYLTAMAFMAALRYTCAYLPFFALIAALVAVLTSWTSQSRRAVSIFCMVCSLCAVFSGVVYLWQILPAAVSATALFDGAQMWAIVAGYVTVLLIPVAFWFATLTQETWISVSTGQPIEDLTIAEVAEDAEAEAGSQPGEDVAAAADVTADAGAIEGTAGVTLEEAGSGSQPDAAGAPVPEGSEPEEADHRQDEETTL